MIKLLKDNRSNFALVLMSIPIVFLVTLINLYYSSNLELNIGYVASSSYELRCAGLIHLSFLGVVLPPVFFLLGIAAITQMVFYAAFHLSSALFALHIIHCAFLTFLLIFGGSYCEGLDIYSVIYRPSETIFFAIGLTIFPIPLMVWQIYKIKRNANASP